MDAAISISGTGEYYTKHAMARKIAAPNVRWRRFCQYWTGVGTGLNGTHCDLAHMNTASIMKWHIAGERKWIATCAEIRDMQNFFNKTPYFRCILGFPLPGTMHAYAVNGFSIVLFLFYWS